MNKKILSLAVAAAMATPLAAQADVTVYGQIQMAVDSVNMHTADDYFTWPVGGIWSSPSLNCFPAAFAAVRLHIIHPFAAAAICSSFPGARGNLRRSVDTWQLNSDNSRLGFKGTEDLGNGLSAIWGIELGVDVAGDSSLGIINNDVVGKGDDITTRNMYAGLSSAQFGTVLAGKHDTPYKIMFGDWDKFAESQADDDQIMKGAAPNRGGLGGVIGEFDGQDTQGFADRRPSNAIAYVSPTLGGVTLAGAVVPAEINSDSGVFSDNAGWSLAGTGAWGPIKASLGGEVLNDLNANRHLDSGVSGIFGSGAWFTGNTYPFYMDQRLRSNDSLWGAAIAFDSSPFYVGLRYEDRTGVDYVDNYDIKQWRLTGTYTWGNNVFKAMYHRLDGSPPDYMRTGDYTGDAWAIGIDHNFSKRTMIYALYTHLNWNIDSRTGLGRWNGFPFLTGGSGVGGAIMNPIGLIGGLGQPTLMDNETYGIGLLHKF